MTTAAWARLGGGRAASPRTVLAFLDHTTNNAARTRPSNFNRHTCALAAASPISENESPQHDEQHHPHIILSSLDLKLRQLAFLNGGITINPRSPKQVSYLLYNNGDGPTDKAALQRIIKRNDDNYEEDDNTAYNNISHSDRREIAKLVLQCRELLTRTTNYNDNCDNNSGIDEQKQQQMQLLVPTSPLASVPLSTRKYSNSALLDTIDDNDVNDDAHQIETTESSFPIIEADIKNSLSLTTYERMVMNLFPNDDDNKRNVSNTTTEEEYYNSIHHAEDDATDTDTNYYTNNNAIIHPYWIEPLLSLTKSSSRLLVKQLSTNAHCPMGYDPMASNLSQQSQPQPQRRGSTTASSTTMSTTITASPYF
jgi:hypothetical protein